MKQSYLEAEIAGLVLDRRVEAGRVRHVATLTCVANPEHKQEVNVTVKGGGTLPVDAVRKKFANQGWLLGKRSHTCPACQGIHAKAAEEPVSEPAQETADVPNQPTAKDMRRIFQLLDDHFEAARGAYDEGWSDESIAKEVAVGVEHVVATREEAYGPLRQNEFEEMRKVLAEAESRCAEGLLEAEEKHTARAKVLKKELVTLSDAVEKANSEYGAAVALVTDAFEQEVASIKERLFKAEAVSQTS